MPPDGSTMSGPASALQRATSTTEAPSTPVPTSPMATSTMVAPTPEASAPVMTDTDGSVYLVLGVTVAAVTALGAYAIVRMFRAHTDDAKKEVDCTGILVDLEKKRAEYSLADARRAAEQKIVDEIKAKFEDAVAEALDVEDIKKEYDRAQKIFDTVQVLSSRLKGEVMDLESRYSMCMGEIPDTRALMYTGPMHNRVVHFEIQADDSERAIVFYQTVFGWTFQRWGEKPYWMIMTAPKDSTEPGINGGLLLRPCPAPSVGQGTNAYVCTVQVENYDETEKKILAAGGTVAMPKFALPGMAWQGYYLDQEGNTFGIHQADPNAK